MEPNDVEEAADDMQNIFDSVVLWLTGQNYRIDGSAGDPRTGGTYESSDPNESEIYSGGENVVQHTGMFGRMRQVFQYQASLEIMKTYAATMNQKFIVEKNAPEDDTTISDLLSLSQTDTLISRPSSWYLESSGSSNVEPSSTDSEVYQISPRESINEEIDIKTLHSDDCIYCDKIKQTSQQKDPVSSQVSNNSNKILNTDDDDKSSEENPLDKNLLLQACILDINDKPMNAMVSQVLNQMLPFIFNAREIQIVRHFIRYKIRITVEEMNRRLRDLQVEHASLRNEIGQDDNSENSNVISMFSSNNSAFLSNPDLRTQESVSHNLSRSLPQIPEEQSIDVISLDFPSNTSQDVNTGADKQDAYTVASDQTITQDSTETHDVSPIRDIFLEEQSCECEGRTKQVLQIMYQMLGLTNRQRYRMLKLHEYLLCDTEYNAVLDYIESAQDLGFEKETCWVHFFSRLQSWYYRRKRSNKQGWLTRLQCWNFDDSNLLVTNMQIYSLK